MNWPALIVTVTSETGNRLLITTVDERGRVTLNSRERVLAWLARVGELPDVPAVGVIVGEMPGSAGWETCTLFPYPSGSAGARLHTMSELSIEQYLARLRRVNLLQTKGGWSEVEAQRRRGELIVEVGPETRMLLLGAHVRASFGLTDLDWFERRGRFCAIPHPSGRNPLYDSPRYRQLAGEAVRWAAGLGGLGDDPRNTDIEWRTEELTA